MFPTIPRLQKRVNFAKQTLQNSPKSLQSVLNKVSALNRRYKDGKLTREQYAEKVKKPSRDVRNISQALGQMPQLLTTIKVSDVEAASKSPSTVTGLISDEALRDCTYKGITDYLLRSTKPIIGDNFATNAELDKDEYNMDFLRKEAMIVDSIQSGDYGPLLRFMNNNQKHFDFGAEGFGFWMNVHTRLYIIMIEHGEFRNAITFLKESFLQHFKTCTEHIKKLIRLLIFGDRMHLSPLYESLNSTTNPDVIIASFRLLYAKFGNVAKEPPLQVLIKNGLEHIKDVNDHHSAGITTAAIPNMFVDVTTSFHSHFICPFTKCSSANPVMLKCGHVVAEDAVSMMSNRGRRCPICSQSFNSGSHIPIDLNKI
ncbi:hypothetical protein PCE1_002914 [Barthelona sp. PCE]